MTRELVREEVFIGEVTGSHNISSINRWVDETKRPFTWNGMVNENVASMIRNHEWDKGWQRRVVTLFHACAENKPWARRPLILIQDGMHGELPSTFVIDGWHRFVMYYKMQKNQEMIKFPAWVFTPGEIEQFKFKPEEVAKLKLITK